jgi:catechol-2,3-dioxygenase
VQLLDHVSLTVRDIGRAKVFYKEILFALGAISFGEATVVSTFWIKCLCLNLTAAPRGGEARRIVRTRTSVGAPE